MGPILISLLLSEVIITPAALIFQFFKLCQLPPVEIRPGIWQVRIDQVLMQELDGWRAQGRLLQFTFDPHLARIYGAELICEGSYRLNTILRLIRKQGLVAQAYLPNHVFDESAIRKRMLEHFPIENRIYVVSNQNVYDQYLWIQVLVTKRGLQKKAKIEQPMVNLFSGEVSKFAIPPRLFVSGFPQQAAIRNQKISFKKAFGNVVRYLEQDLAKADDHWAQQALSRQNKEQSELDSFFEHQRESEDYQRKTEEVKINFAPIIEIDAIRAALLSIPLYRYRLMIVDNKGREQIKNVYYNPISNLPESYH